MTPSLLTFLAGIADSYTPILFLLSLTICLYQWRKGFKWYWVRLALIAIVSYVMMFIDNGFHLWEKVGLDFSTHAATSLGLVIFLSLWGSKQMGCAAGASFVMYCILMDVLNYHTWGDMVSTSIAMALLFFTIIKLSEKRVGHKE